MPKRLQEQPPEVLSRNRKAFMMVPAGFSDHYVVEAAKSRPATDSDTYSSPQPFEHATPIIWTVRRTNDFESSEASN